MDSKPWYKSRAIWSGLAAVLASAYDGLALLFGWHAIPGAVYGVLAGVFGITLRLGQNVAIQ